jgi:hypothetical protein
MIDYESMWREKTYDFQSDKDDLDQYVDMDSFFV